LASVPARDSAAAHPCAAKFEARPSLGARGDFKVAARGRPHAA